jgi:hypothetical protein
VPLTSRRALAVTSVDPSLADSTLMSRSFA